jgi:V8-like Glu-specific endopeptidase
MDHQTYVVAKAKHVFSNLKELEERLAAQPESIIAPVSGTGEYARRLDIVDRLDLERAVYAERLHLIEAGRRGIGKIRTADDTRPSLTPEEMLGVEAIIQLEGRPALLIEGGKFEAPPAEWGVLDSYRESIETAIASVGRVEVTGHPRLDWVGTGFLVAPDVIMTNRHVAVEFSEKRSGEGWKFIPGITPRIDFKEEFQSTTEAEFTCVEVIGIQSKVDLALLRIELSATSNGANPAPLTVHYRSPRGYRGRKVYVIGYPAWDGRRNDPAPMQRIFADIYDVKRLQPGTIRSFFVAGKTFTHDSSTLGGNSGSCVVDLESGKVIGLHFAGRYMKGNSAVALWKLRKSALLRKANVNFG